MDIKSILDKLSLQLEEVNLHILEIKETLTKQKNEELHKRMERLEASSRDQHLKLDALNSINIAQVEPRVVKVVKPDEEKEFNPEVEPVSATKKSNIIEFFKDMYVTHRAQLLTNHIISQEIIDAAYDTEKIKTEISKGKSNQLTIDKKVAGVVWKMLDKSRKEIAHSYKKEMLTIQQKNSSKDVHEECL